MPQFVLDVSVRVNAENENDAWRFVTHLSERLRHPLITVIGVSEPDMVDEDLGFTSEFVRRMGS